MKKRKKFIPHLLLFIFSFICLVFLVNSSGPRDPLILFGVQIPSFPVFYILIFLTFAALSSFVFANLRRGFLIGIFMLIFLTLQYLRYNNIVYTIILIAIVLLIELMFWKGK